MKFKHTYRRAADCVSAPEELTNTVLQIPKQTKPRGISRPLRLVAVAAVLALVIGILSFWPAGDKEYVTGPGLLAIRAYALNENEISEINSTVLEEGVELPWEYFWSAGYSIVPLCYGLPINLSISADVYEGEEITFEIYTTGGSLNQLPELAWDSESNSIVTIKKSGLGDSATLTNNATVYWNWNYVAFDSKRDDYISTEKVVTENAYVNIISYAGKHIVGYASVEIYELPSEDNENSGMFMARLLASVAFPKVDGKYQKITKEYVQDQLIEVRGLN